MASYTVAALEGDFLDRLAEIARACGRKPLGSVRAFSDWASAAVFARQPNHLGAVRSGGWTVLVDDGAFTADLFDQPEVGEALARQYDTRVASAFGCSAIGSCGYRVHSPAGTRSVVVDVDGVVEDEGEPLPGEVTDDIDQHDMYSVLDTLALLELDVEEGVESSTRCAVLRLAPKRGRRPGSKGTPNPAL